MIFNHINERTGFPRFRVDLPLKYRGLDVSQAHGGMVINASESGLLVHSVKEIPVGTRLNIAVLFPDEYELAHFEVSAEIIWKDTLCGENREGYQLGLKFIHIVEEEHEKLKRLLAESRER